jgi:hypothetical protein
MIALPGQGPSYDTAYEYDRLGCRFLYDDCVCTSVGPRVATEERTRYLPAYVSSVLIWRIDVAPLWAADPFHAGNSGERGHVPAGTVDSCIEAQI